MRQVLRVGLLTIVAAVVGVCGSFVHAATARPAGLPIPYGLVLALLGVASVLVLAQQIAAGRLGKGVVAAGWLLPVMLLSLTSPAGDIVVASDARGLGYLFGGVILVGVAVGLPGRRRVDRRRNVSGGVDARLG